jgi:hypothetical protein
MRPGFRPGGAASAAALGRRRTRIFSPYQEARVSICIINKPPMQMKDEVWNVFSARYLNRPGKRNAHKLMDCERE